MLFLVTVLASHLVWVFFGSIHVAVSTVAVRGINTVNSGGWSRTISLSLLVAVVAVFLFFFLAF